MKKTVKRRLLCLLLAAVLVCMSVPLMTASAAGIPTSLGMAAHGIKAHRDGWLYQGGAKGYTDSSGRRYSDCAGLLYAYFVDMGAVGGCAGGATSQVRGNCVFSNDIKEGLPRIHGLALTMPDYNDPGSGIYGHIGIYIGNNEACDNSDYQLNMRREPVVGNSRNWTAWHVFDNGMKYPVSGWYALDGRMVHYTNYEYDVNVTIDGYTIGPDGYAAENGKYASVDNSLLSSQYASASEVASYLRTRYSGKDSTYELIYGGPSPSLPAPEPVYNAKITASEVNLRKFVTTTSDIIATLDKGAKVNILDESAGQPVTFGGKTSSLWYSIAIPNGKWGYISSLFVERVNVASFAPVINSSDGYVIISSLAGADIYYTTDGSEPTEKSTPYTGPMYNMMGFTYRAMASIGGLQSEVTTTTVLSDGSVFKDFTVKDWFFKAVDSAVELGIFHGNGDGTFTPNRSITRIQFVTALAGLDGVDLTNFTDETGFPDVTKKGSTMTKAVAWAARNGYVNGFTDGKFHPNDRITREQMCVILANYAGLQFGGDTGDLFEDDENISTWAKDAVYACRAQGLINGVGGNKFNPKGAATRAQVCVIMVKLSDK